LQALGVTAAGQACKPVFKLGIEDDFKPLGGGFAAEAAHAG
jgi:hypothetical protein